MAPGTLNGGAPSAVHAPPPSQDSQAPARDIAALQRQIAEQQELLQKLAAQLAHGASTASQVGAESGGVPASSAVRVESTLPARESATLTGTKTGGDKVKAEESAGKESLPLAPAVTNPPAGGTSDGQSAAGTSGASSASPDVASSPVSPAGASGALSDDDRRAYASGVSLGHELLQSLALQKGVGLTLNPDMVLSGLEDSYRGRELKMGDDDIRQALASLNDDFTRRMQSRRDEEVAQGNAFRKDFRRQKGVMLDAGSLYLIGKKGFGRLRTTDLATVQITGRLPDGTVFDGSGETGQTRKVKVGAMLPAIAIGLQKIGVGGHITIVVPPEKGYGDMGQPPAVPGGATLIFDITVQGVNEGG